MKCFTVKFSDLVDREKNPGLNLDFKSILENDKIPKLMLTEAEG